MPLAEAITQFSFLEFLQRCGVSIAPPQPSQPPVPISLEDATVQTTPPYDVSHQVSTQTSVQQDTLSCDVAVQTIFHSVRSSFLDAAVQTVPHSIFSQDVSTQMGSRPASSFSVDTSVQTPIRCVVEHDAATRLERSRSSSLAAFTRTALWTAKTLFVSPRHQCRILMSYLSHRLDLNSQSLPVSLLLIRTCSPMLAALPAIPCSRLSVPLMWEHTLYAQLPAPRGVPEPTTLLAPIFVQMQASSPNQRQ